MEIWTFWMLVLLVVLLVVFYLIAREFQRVAEMKGYQSKKYFWICFFCGLAGYLLVIALPERGTTQVQRPNNQNNVVSADNALPKL